METTLDSQAQAPRSVLRTVKWLWFVVVLLLWPVVTILCRTLATRLVESAWDAPSIFLVTKLVTIALVTTVAWALARFAVPRHAPFVLWIALVLVSVPDAALAVYSSFEQRTPLWALLAFPLLVMPAAAFALEARRLSGPVVREPQPSAGI